MNRNNQIVLLALMVCAICVIPSFGADKLTTTLERYQKQPIQISYKLNVYWFVREKSSSRKGTALFTPQDEFRITLGSYIWICDGDTVWQYSKRRSQVTIYSVDRAPLEMPQRLFSFLLKTDFAVGKKSGEDVVASWKQDSSSTKLGYQEATITYNETSTTISKIELVDSEGNQFTYKIIETLFSPAVSPEQFHFTIPERTEVIEKL